MKHLWQQISAHAKNDTKMCILMKTVEGVADNVIKGLGIEMLQVSY